MSFQIIRSRDSSSSPAEKSPKISSATKSKSAADDPETMMSSGPSDTQPGKSILKGQDQKVAFKDRLTTYANDSGDDDGKDAGRKEEHLTPEEEAIRAQFTPQEIRDLRMVFDTFDREKTGCIDVADIRRAMRVLGFKISMKTVTTMVEDLNEGRNGLVSFSEFLEIVVVRQGDARDPYDELIQGFQMMDYGKRGKISYTDLKRAAKEAGIKFSDRQIWEMIEEADLNGDRMVNQNEFIKVMLQSNLF